KIFGSDGKILGVVIAPVEAWGIAEPLVLAAAPQLSVRGAELVHGDLIGLGVAHEPLIGIETVVTGAEMPDHFVDGAGVLNGHAGAESDGRALGIERRLADGGFGEHDPSVVLIPIGGAFDAARVTLHEDAGAILGFDVEPDVSLLSEGKRPPSDVTDHHPAIARGGAGGGKGAAMLQDGIAFL